MEAEENRSPAGGGGGAQDPGGHAPRGSRGDKTSPEGGGGGGGGHERRAWTDTPNAELLVALSRWVWRSKMRTRRRRGDKRLRFLFFACCVVASAFNRFDVLHTIWQMDSIVSGIRRGSLRKMDEFLNVIRYD